MIRTPSSWSSGLGRERMRSYQRARTAEQEQEEASARREELESLELVEMGVEAEID